MIFAREINDSLTSLVKKVEAATVKHGDKDMGSFVVFLSDDKGFDKKLEELAKKEGLKECTLSLDNAEGPEAYNVAKEADVTVVLYRQQKVEANFAYRKGELNAAAVAAIVAELPKILD
jgi:hypothetical protein